MADWASKCKLTCFLWPAIASFSYSNKKSRSPLLTGGREGCWRRIGRDGRRWGAGATCFGLGLVFLLVVRHVLEHVDLEHRSAVGHAHQTNPNHETHSELYNGLGQKRETAARPKQRTVDWLTDWAARHTLTALPAGWCILLVLRLAHSRSLTLRQGVSPPECEHPPTGVSAAAPPPSPTLDTALVNPPENNCTCVVLSDFFFISAFKNWRREVKTLSSPHSASIPLIFLLRWCHHGEKVCQECGARVF